MLGMGKDVPWGCPARVSSRADPHQLRCPANMPTGQREARVAGGSGVGGPRSLGWGGSSVSPGRAPGASWGPGEAGGEVEWSRAEAKPPFP